MSLTRQLCVEFHKHAQEMISMIIIIIMVKINNRSWFSSIAYIGPINGHWRCDWKIISKSRGFLSNEISSKQIATSTCSEIVLQKSRALADNVDFAICYELAGKLLLQSLINSPVLSSEVKKRHLAMKAWACNAMELTSHVQLTWQSWLLCFGKCTVDDRQPQTLGISASSSPLHCAWAWALGSWQEIALSVVGVKWLFS